MFSLILSTPSIGGSAHGMGYLYMAGTGSLLVLTALLRRSSWQPWTIAVWSVGLGLVAINFPALWWEHYPEHMRPVFSHEENPRTARNI